MKKYNYINKKVTIKNKYGNLQEFEAHILDPKNQHSTVNGIIWRSYSDDIDGWNKYVRWQSDIYILPKKSTQWKLFYSGLSKDCPIGGESGLFLMLFNLESQEVQNEINVKFALMEAKENIDAALNDLANAKERHKELLALQKKKGNKK